MIEESPHVRLNNSCTETERVMKKHGIDLREDEANQWIERNWKR